MKINSNTYNLTHKNLLRQNKILLHSFMMLLKSSV